MPGEITTPTVQPLLLGKQVNALICGGGHSFAICSTGNVYAWGTNGQHQCGLQGSPVETPTPLILRSKVKAGAAGLGHTVLLLEDNTVVGAGWNNTGQLGSPGLDRIERFTEIAGLEGINYISCGAAHTLFVDKEGKLLGCGGNSCGQLGLGHTEDMFTPVLIETLKKFISFCKCGEEFSAVITKDHEVYCFGLGNVGQLGNGEDFISTVPVEVKEVPGKLKTEYLACTQSQVLAITSAGRTFTWGSVPDYTTMQSKLSKPIEVTGLKAKEVREVHCLRNSFLISLKYANPYKSYISNIPLKPVKAGTRFTFKVILVNNDLEFSTQIGDCLVGRGFALDTDECSKGSFESFYDYGHTIDAIIQESGHHEVFIWCNGVLLNNCPFVYTVCSAKPKVLEGHLHLHTTRQTADKILVYAGNQFYLNVVGYDAFGNKCEELNGLESSDIRVEGVGKYQILFEDLGYGNAKIEVTLEEAGDFELRVVVFGTEICIVKEDLGVENGESLLVEVGRSTSFGVQVIPGYTYGPKCYVSGMNRESSAGDTVSFLINSIDVYGNTTWHNTKQFAVEVSCQGNRIDCFTEIGVDYTTRILSFTPKLSGEYIVKVAYSDTAIYTDTVIVKPGPPLLLFTTVLGDGFADGVLLKNEKHNKSIELHFYDQYRNPTPSPPTVFIFTPPLQHTVSQPSFSSVLVEYTVSSPGTYTIDITNLQIPLFPVIFTISRDPKKAKREQEELRQLKLKQIEEEQLRLLQERKLREEEELKKKTFDEEQQSIKLLKLQEDRTQTLQQEQEKNQLIELEKRKRIVERIKKQEITKRRATHALKLMEEQKLEERKHEKKSKRTGGGFIVPFDN